MRFFPLIIGLAIALFGCATPKLPITEALPPKFLAKAQERKPSGTGLIYKFPAGFYRPAFRDANGTYYKPDAQIVHWSTPDPSDYLFISNETPARHGLWTDGGTHVWWISEPLPFDPTPDIK